MGGTGRAPNSEGTLPGLLFGAPLAPVLAQIPRFWPVSGPLYLDSPSPVAISPATRRGIFSRRLFLCGSWDRFPIAREFAAIYDRRGESITTEEKAGPDLSEAGIEHEGI